MNILLTGGAGYLGSVLISELLTRKHKLRVIDIGYFGINHLKPFFSHIEFIREDIRKTYKDNQFREDIVKDCDCIIHLAALSDDRSCEFFPKLSEEINVKVTEVLAEIAKKKNIKFIFASSCSVYGRIEHIAIEESSLNPLSLYALSKVKAEEIINNLIISRWKAVILRCGTLFGYSPRMRFDLVINIFSLQNALYNRITIFGEGNEWRPFLHVRDAALAFLYFVEKEELKYNCYNLAYENLKIKDVAYVFKSINPSIEIIHNKDCSSDQRNYRVAVEKMKEEGFYPTIDVSTGAQEIIQAINTGLIRQPASIRYCNVKWLDRLINAKYREFQKYTSNT
ncbi:MAG: SDR family oxidoreductase [Candidatus Omnitrophica bacterium]|nr:SDR family oxidoreductase [Candidatus Omnitrophota bacterium]